MNRKNVSEGEEMSGEEEHTYEDQTILYNFLNYQVLNGITWDGMDRDQFSQMTWGPVLTQGPGTVWTGTSSLKGFRDQCRLRDLSGSHWC